nr:hypothetical protein [Tanacetum cinerariifolium]
KRSGDVTRLQALVDKKKIVLSEAVIRKILQLNNAEGVVCLPNEEIFTGLAQMGYEKPSTKLTFYKAFFSSQWKFLTHTILQSLSAKRTSWNEFRTAMASVVICLSKGQRFNFSKYIFNSMVRNVDSSSKFYMYPRFIQLIIQTNIVDLSTHTTRYISPALTQKVFTNMRRVGKGFSSIKTPLFEIILVVRDVAKEAEAQVLAQGDNVQEPATEEVVPEDVPPTPMSSSPPSPVLATCSALALSVEGLENDKAAQQLEIVKLKAMVKKLEKINKVKSFKLERLKKVKTSQRVESSDDMENVFNQGRKIVNMDQDEGIKLVADQEKDAEFEGRHADKQAEIYNIDLDHSSKVLSMQEDDTEVQEAVEIVTTAKIMTEVVTAAATQVAAASTHIHAINKEHEESYKNIDWNAALDHSREEMEEEDEEIIKSINETPMQKAAKRRKLHEQAKEDEDLKKQLEYNFSFLFWCMSTRSSAGNLFPPLANPELTIQRRSRVDPALLNDFEMATEGNGDPPVLDHRTREELCQPSLNGRGGPIAPISIQATNFRLKNDMIQQV